MRTTAMKFHLDNHPSMCHKITPYRCFVSPQFQTKHNLRFSGESGVPMVAPLDVFAVMNGEPKWLSCVETLSQAVDLIRKTGCGSYFVFSQPTGHKDFYEITAEGVVLASDS